MDTAPILQNFTMILFYCYAGGYVRPLGPVSHASALTSEPMPTAHFVKKWVFFPPLYGNLKLLYITQITGLCVS